MELSERELAWLAGVLTYEQKEALIDSGWADLEAAVSFAVSGSPAVREAWEARLEEPPLDPRVWRQFLAWRFWDLAVPVLVANPVKPDVAAEDGPAQPPGPSPTAPTRPPLPNETLLLTFAYGTVQKAVKSFIQREATAGDVARGAKMPMKDARRVRLMIEPAGLLSLNPSGKLVVDERVARKGMRYALRFLNDAGDRWLDPLVALRGR